eukprot:NODE_15_length_50561_cov_0.608081.p32 type:complete len:116 gc:universal NODE_15_length_50561_cov_0.608081:17586-17933(+)
MSRKDRKYHCGWAKCMFSSTDGLELKNHVIEHHLLPIEDCNFKCKWVTYYDGSCTEICKYRTDKIQRIKSHIDSHMEYRPYECIACNISFKRKFDSKKHYKTVHLKNIESVLIDQ